MADEGSFLGTGWGFPPRFAAGGAEVEMVSGVDDVHQSLRILLATQLGERVMRPDFGCDLGGVLFEEVGQRLVNRIAGLVGDAILYHEPRVKLGALDVSESPTEPGLLFIKVEYTVRGVNSRFNLVYPFYLNEGAPPGA
jgi:uncharacterized protein